MGIQRCHFIPKGPFCIFFLGVHMHIVWLLSPLKHVLFSQSDSEDKHDQRKMLRKWKIASRGLRVSTITSNIVVGIENDRRHILPCSSNSNTCNSCENSVQVRLRRVLPIELVEFIFRKKFQILYFY